MRISIDAIKNRLSELMAMVRFENIRSIIESSERLEVLFRNRRMKKFIRDLRLFLMLLRDYVTGEYRQIPWSSIACIVATLLYVLSPIDLIPDMIPLAGFLDDAMMVGLCLNMVHSDLDRYRLWKEGGTGDVTPVS